MSAVDPHVEAEALADWRAGDILAGDRLVRMHAGLICSVVSKYISPRCELDDLLQTGRIALLDAVADYDSLRSKFSTFAHLKIDGAAWRYARAGRFIVSDGTRKKDAHRHAAYLDAPVGEGGETLGSMLAAPSTDCTIAVDIDELVATLPRRERDVLRRHYTGDGETLQAIGDSIGLSRERVRQIKQDGVERLQRRVAA